jgi:hypothetical protein
MKHGNSDTSRSAGRLESFLLIGILLFSIWGTYHLFQQNEKPAEDIELEAVELSLNFNHETDSR